MVYIRRMVSIRSMAQFWDDLNFPKALSPEDQVQLIDIIYRRLVERRRSDLVDQVTESRQAYRTGQVRRGTVDDLLAELSSD